MKARLPLIAVFLFLVVLELISAKIKGQVSGFAALLWLLQYAIIAAATLYLFFKLIFDELREKSLFVPVFYLAAFILLAFIPFATPFININYESSLQAASGLDAFSQPDLNYHGTAFLGYGARQYLINALPTLIFGRSLAALNFGFFQVLILGWMAYSVGIFRWTKKMGVASQYAIIPSAAVLFTPMLTDHYLTFEQVSSPPSIALLLIGWVLIYLDKKDNFSVFTVAWIACLAYYSYTPSISTLGLLFLLSVVVIFTKRMDRFLRMDAAIVLVFVLAFLSAVIFFTAGRGDGAFQVLMPDFARVLAAFKGIVFGPGDDGNIVAGGNFGILAIPIFIYSLISISGRVGRYHTVVIVWALFVYAASVTLQGHSMNDPYYAMSFRTQQVTPVLITGLYFLLSKHRVGFSLNEKSSVSVSIIILFLAFLGSCFYTSHKVYWLGPKKYNMKYILQDMHNDIKMLNLKGLPVDAVAYISAPGMNFYDFAGYHFYNIKEFSIMDYQIPEELLTCRNVVMYGDASAIAMKEQEGLKIYEKNVRDHRLGENYKYYRFEVLKTQRADGVGCL